MVRSGMDSTPATTIGCTGRGDCRIEPANLTIHGMQAKKLKTSPYERIPLSRAVRSVFDCQGERAGELEGGFAAIPA